MNIIERPRVYWNGSYWAVRPYYVAVFDKRIDAMLDKAYTLCEALNMSN